MLESQQRACTLEAEFALLLRISHKYGKSGGQVLFSMGALEHIASCRATNFKVKTYSYLLFLCDLDISLVISPKVHSREI